MVHIALRYCFLPACRCRPEVVWVLLVTSFINICVLYIYDTTWRPTVCFKGVTHTLYAGNIVYARNMLGFAGVHWHGLVGVHWHSFLADERKI